MFIDSLRWSPFSSLVIKHNADISQVLCWCGSRCQLIAGIGTDGVIVRLGLSWDHQRQSLTIIINKFADALKLFIYLRCNQKRYTFHL